MRKVLFILGDLADTDIDWLISNGQYRDVAGGQTLIDEGRAIDAIYILLGGELSVSLNQGEDVIATLYPGEVVGELSFLDSRPPNATVTAVGQVSVLEIPRETIRLELESNTAFSARFYRALGVFMAERLRTTTRQIGYGQQQGLDALEDPDEAMDIDLLDQVNLAAKRFEYILERFRQ